MADHEVLVELIEKMNAEEVKSVLIEWIWDHDDNDKLECMSDIIDSLYQDFDEERARGVENAE